MSHIEIREAYYSELPRIAHVLARAFRDDNLLGDLIHPHRKEYPSDMDLYWLRRARVNYWDYTCKWLVAVANSGGGNEIIVGVAQWARLGEGGKKMGCYWFDPRSLLKPLSSAAMKAHAFIWPNRACNPQAEDIMERTYPYLDGVWSGERAESWYLETLGVHPEYQGKGVGRMLVDWGLKRAEEEGICASVISARGKDGFYRQCGFDLQEGSAGMGEGNPTANVEGGNMFWKMPL